MSIAKTIARNAETAQGSFKQAAAKTGDASGR